MAGNPSLPPSPILGQLGTHWACPPRYWRPGRHLWEMSSLSFTQQGRNHLRRSLWNESIPVLHRELGSAQGTGGAKSEHLGGGTVIATGSLDCCFVVFHKAHCVHPMFTFEVKDRSDIEILPQRVQARRTPRVHNFVAGRFIASHEPFVAAALLLR